jgi:hypothetical protein
MRQDAYPLVAVQQKLETDALLDAFCSMHFRSYLLLHYSSVYSSCRAQAGA